MAFAFGVIVGAVLVLAVLGAIDLQQKRESERAWAFDRRRSQLRREFASRAA